MSWPFRRISPLRRRITPMMDFSVVVLPAPLRPRSVTVSPSRTSRSTPCSTWLSPYQACSPRTERSGSVKFRPHVGLAHPRIAADGVVAPFGEHLAALEHGDAVAEIRDDVEVVLDHHDRAALGDAADELGDLADILVRHAGHRLVEQHHVGLERHGGGE